MTHQRKCGKRPRGKQCEALPYEGVTTKEIKKEVTAASKRAEAREARSGIPKRKGFNHW